MSTLFETLRSQPDYKYVVKVKSYQDDRLGEWCVENTVGLWMRDIDIDDNYEFKEDTFFFDTEKDALMFTLKWAK